MCLLVLAWRAHPRYRLVVAANRDEFHERPAAALARWPAPANILAGRDLRAGGTWLGLDPQRRFGVVTNFRDLQRPQPGAPSRGELIPRFLTAAHAPEEFFTSLQPQAASYSGFNLLLADQDSLWYGSNRATPFARPLAPGVYGLSNEFLDTPWPKLERVRTQFRHWLAADASGTAGLLALLNDRTRVADDSLLPETGITRKWERILSAPFVQHPDYGTRSSTVLLVQADGQLQLTERRFDPSGAPAGESEFTLPPGAWP
jgi:uncharacterized protein with NRDE domain